MELPTGPPENDDWGPPPTVGIGLPTERRKASHIGVRRGDGTFGDRLCVEEPKNNDLGLAAPHPHPVPADHQNYPDGAKRKESPHGRVGKLRCGDHNNTQARNGIGEAVCNVWIERHGPSMAHQPQGSPQYHRGILAEVGLTFRAGSR